MVSEAPKRSRSYLYAADQQQAADLLDALSGYFSRTDGLAGAVSMGASVVTVKATGATLSVESTDSASAWSKRPWVCVVDELTSWPQTRNYTSLWTAIVSSLPKRKDSKLIVLSMAGSPTHFAAPIWRLAQASPDWRASNTRGPCERAAMLWRSGCRSRLRRRSWRRQCSIT
jgi:phage terminase large subunit-like protein